MTHYDDVPHYRCLHCATIFEFLTADPGPNGEPRCPQCFLLDSELWQPRPDDFVVDRQTPFR